jgi:predicted nucleic acid-binding protein
VAERQVTFVDTNVLAYAYDRSEPRKQAVAQAQLGVLWRDRTGALSTQVLQELYVVATRKLAAPMQRQIDVPLILAASDLEERHALSFWDALVVEAARRSGAARLLTEDLQHGRQIGGVRIENPFS